MLHIRKATLSDAEALAQLGAETFYHTFRPYNSESDMQAYLQKAYGKEAVAADLQNNGIAYFLCFDEDAPVGYIKLILNTTYGNLIERCVELEKIYVLHDYFGNGAGQLLMDKAITFTQENNFETLFLGVWQENERAVAFYQKNGFETFATRTFQLGQRMCEDFMMKLKV